MTEGPETVIAEAAGRDQRDDVLTRGFLFADLRGYTSFVEQHGAAAAADLLYRYRALVRDAVARQHGAEIKTEGDSFYVVFISVSRAVACGLDIVAAAHDASAEYPTQPIDVGIGVHAGETVETAEGYVGSAVNMAARLGAAADSAEVLVSETVRALTANASGIAYEAAGRRRLKGIADPVAVFRALPQGSAVRGAAPRASRRLMLVGAGLAAVALTLAAGILGRDALLSGLGTTASPSPDARVEPSPRPSAPASPPPSAPPSAAEVGTIPVGPLNPGTYVSRLLYPGVTFSVGTGWSLVEELPQGLHLSRSAGPGMDLYILPFRGAIDPTDPDGYARVEGVENAHQLIDWIAEHESVVAEAPLLLDLPNGRGEAIDFVAEVPPDMSERCGYPCVMLVWVTEDIDAFDRFAIADGFLYRLVAVDRILSDLAPPTMIVLLEVQRPEDFEAFAAEAQGVINTVTFADE